MTSSSSNDSFSSFSTYTFNASREKSGSMAKKVSSLMKSIKSANSGSITLHCQIDKTFIFHLSLAFPGNFDVTVQKISGEFGEFHGYCDIGISSLVHVASRFN